MSTGDGVTATSGRLRMSGFRRLLLARNLGTAATDQAGDRGDLRHGQLLFAQESDDDILELAKDRGYLSHVLVETTDGQLFPVTFYDAVRVAQDVEEDTDGGLVADPGMIVLRTLTRETMERAVRVLCEGGYFSHLRPLDGEGSDDDNPYEWPPRRRVSDPGET
ncbi:MAG: hypothetical protein H6708_05070 [Kofleriaceae bacterium]|nr:hypothetical protein [Myxococcales bacterium]MCB9559759.1 hypothetical protein [Kofleriaceae bacterium]